MKHLSFNVENYPVDILACKIVDSINLGHSNRSLSCINPHSYVMALKDKVFKESLENSDVMIVDGIGVKLASLFFFATM